MFEVGDRVVCIKEDWYFIKKFLGIFKYKKTGAGPKREEPCIVSEIHEIGYIALEGYPMNYYYNPAYFRKIDDTFAEQVLANIAQKVKEEQLTEV